MWSWWARSFCSFIFCQSTILCLHMNYKLGAAGNGANEGSPSKFNPPPRSPTSTAKNGDVERFETWHCLWHEKRHKAYWVTDKELIEKMSTEKLRKDWKLPKLIQSDWDSELERLQRKETDEKSSVTEINGKVNTLQAEFLQFRQNTATSLQINSSLRTTDTHSHTRQQFLFLFQLQLLVGRTTFSD